MLTTALAVRHPLVAASGPQHPPGRQGQPVRARTRRHSLRSGNRLWRPARSASAGSSPPPRKSFNFPEPALALGFGDPGVAVLIARVAEAKREGWLGEVEGLAVSLAVAEEKLNQLTAEQRRRTTVVNLSMPTFGQIATRTSRVATP